MNTKIYRTIAKYTTEIEQDFLKRGKSSFLPYTQMNACWIVDLIADEQEAEAARIIAEFKRNRQRAKLQPFRIPQPEYDPPCNSTRVSFTEMQHYAWLRKP